MYVVLDFKKQGGKEDSITVSSVSGGVITTSFESLERETLYVVAKPDNYDMLSFFPKDSFRSVTVVNPWLLKITGECDEGFLVNSPGFFNPVFFQPLDFRNMSTYRVLSGTSNNHPVFPSLLKSGMTTELIVTLMAEIVDPRWFYNGSKMVNSFLDKIKCRDGCSDNLVDLVYNSIADSSPLHQESLYRFQMSRAGSRSPELGGRNTFQKTLFKTSVDFLLQQWIGKINLDFRFSDSFFKSDKAKKLHKKSR